jgi:opacity protein-like surface antigen
MHRQLLYTMLPLCMAAQAGAGDFEIIPFVGYRFGGSLDEQDSDYTRDFDAGTDWGVILGHAASATTRYELLYSYQDSGLTDRTDPDNAFDLEIHYLHLGGTVDIVQQKLTPFVSGGLGMTHLSPNRYGLDNETLFSLSLGGGLKWYPTTHLGFRFEVRGYGTLTDSSGSLFCDGECNLRVNGTYLPQYETNLGLIFSF